MTENLTEFIFQVAFLLISFAVPVVTTFVVKYLQVKLSNEKLKKIIAMTEQAVKAVEVLYPGKGSGIMKKSDVYSYIASKMDKTFTSEDIEKLIESVVFDINRTAKPLIFDTNVQTSQPVTYASTKGGD